MLEYIVFYLLAIVAVATSLVVVAQRSTVYGALSLIVAFAAIAGLFIQLGAHFLGAIQMIVYAGAIMVLFLFVIMLLDPGSESFPARRQGLLAAALIPSLGLIGLALLATLRREGQAAGNLGETGGVSAIARSLFRDYLLPFELTSILILVAVIGAVVLAKERS